jgi:hypothetical protein
MTLFGNWLCLQFLTLRVGRPSQLGADAWASQRSGMGMHSTVTVPELVSVHVADITLGLAGAGPVLDAQESPTQLQKQQTEPDIGEISAVRHSPSEPAKQTQQLPSSTATPPCQLQAGELSTTDGHVVALSVQAEDTVREGNAAPPAPVGLTIGLPDVDVQGSLEPGGPAQPDAARPTTEELLSAIQKPITPGLVPLDRRILCSAR